MFVEHVVLPHSDVETVVTFVRRLETVSLAVISLDDYFNYCAIMPARIT